MLHDFVLIKCNVHKCIGLIYNYMEFYQVNLWWGELHIRYYFLLLINRDYEQYINKG